MTLIYDEVTVANWFFNMADGEIEQAIKDAKMMLDVMNIIPDLTDKELEIRKTVQAGLVLLESR